MKKILISTFAAAIALIPGFQGKAAGEIGIVDNGRITAEYGKAVDVQKTAESYQEKLTGMLKQTSEELEKTLKDSKATEAQKTQKQKEAQEKIIAERKKMEGILQKMRDEVLNEVKVAIQEEAKAQNLVIVVPSNMALYGGKDITANVLTRLGAAPKAAANKPKK